MIEDNSFKYMTSKVIKIHIKSDYVYLFLLNLYKNENIIKP